MKYRSLIAFFLAIFLGFLTACSSSPTAGNDALSYDDIRGSGLANNCPEISESSLDSIKIATGQSYQLKELCLEPKTFLVKRSPRIKRQNSQFELTKPLTRESFTLDQVSGSLKADSNGMLTFSEQGGFDFQPVTVQLPDGERVPLLFTIKGLVAQNQDSSGRLSTSSRLVGTFDVPPYRTSSFIDPKGRGLSMGYDAAVGLPVNADSEEYARPNTKVFDIDQGTISLQINRVNQATGEVAGLFESAQPSDTDFGSKEVMDVKIQGHFYGRIEPETI
ncbi:MAG: photosystem II manganese-stabilizing polypeptide [Leptolyngbyaceae cyanobacterium]